MENEPDEMKLYLLRNLDPNRGYDTYDSCVVCAKDSADALTIGPDGKVFSEQETCGWVGSISELEVKLIGVATRTMDRGVIVASFNAM